MTVKTHVRDYSRSTLAPRHRAVVRAFAEAFFFDPDAPFAEGELDALVRECDGFISPASKTLRFGLRMVLEALRLLPILVVGRFALFEDLPTQARIHMLERMERSKFVLYTLIVIGYKTILAVLFFEDPRELAATGYPGPERKRWLRMAGAGGGVNRAHRGPAMSGTSGTSETSEKTLRASA
jgi:hypothetical protein